MKKLDRLEFVKYWAAYVREKPDKVWSSEQAELINSQLKGNQLTREQYMEIRDRLRRI